jgi:phosphoglycerate dehydrogenase-like enzyme
MSSIIVLVTEPEFYRASHWFSAVAGIKCLAAPFEETALAEAVVRTGARHLVLGPAKYSDTLYRVLPRGGVLARFGVGHDGIDKDRATAAGLLCTNTPGVLDDSVAEHAMLLVLAAARHVAAFDREMRQRSWTPRVGAELRGRTLAIIGCGRIGRATASIASRGFGMRVVGYRRLKAAADDPGSDFHTLTHDFAAAVKDASFVSLHIAATAETLGFMNRERLSAMREDAWLINTARGAVVDEAALYDAVSDRRIGGAALDVFDREPYEPADPGCDLRTLDNVILTPHVGSNTVEANRRMAERALANIRLAEAGRFAEMDLLNPDVLRGARDR